MFRKNFYDELQRIPTEAISEQLIQENLPPGSPSIKTPGSHYQPSLYESASARKRSESIHKPQRPPFIIPPLQLGRTDLDPSPVSPQTQSALASDQTLAPQSSKQTPLQKHLAHLARYGMNAVSSGPGERSLAGNSDSQSGGSPRGSFVNVGNQVIDAAVSGVSLVSASNQGSLNSNSLKSRFSRFGSFNFGRREGDRAGH